MKVGDTVAICIFQYHKNRGWWGWRYQNMPVKNWTKIQLHQRYEKHCCALHMAFGSIHMALVRLVGSEQNRHVRSMRYRVASGDFQATQWVTGCRLGSPKVVVVDQKNPAHF